jgi:hypothetical protein
VYAVPIDGMTPTDARVFGPELSRRIPDHLRNAPCKRRRDAQGRDGRRLRRLPALRDGRALFRTPASCSPPTDLQRPEDPGSEPLDPFGGASRPGAGPPLHSMPPTAPETPRSSGVGTVRRRRRSRTHDRRRAPRAGTAAPDAGNAASRAGAQRSPVRATAVVTADAHETPAQDVERERRSRRCYATKRSSPRAPRPTATLLRAWTTRRQRGPALRAERAITSLIGPAHALPPGRSDRSGQAGCWFSRPQRRCASLGRDLHQEGSVMEGLRRTTSHYAPSLFSTARKRSKGSTWWL